MYRHIAAVLLFYCFVTNSTAVTWRQILPNYCGLRHVELEEKLEELPRVRRSADVQNKIANGNVSTIDDHPWQVAIIKSDNKDFGCGGSIISKYHVLTAAHCFTKEAKEKINGVSYKSVSVSHRDRLVAVGSSRHKESTSVYKIKEAYIHKFYSFNHLRNDIALLIIDGEFQWSIRVWPICLPSEDEQYTPQRDCVISGFGALGTDQKNHLQVIRSGNVTLSSDNYCKTQYKILDVSVTEGMFCASGYSGEAIPVVDTCQGDSGGPLNCESTSSSKQVLLGITSYGHGCGLKNYPGIYTKVSKYVKWIHERVEVSLGYGYGHRRHLPEDQDVGRPNYVSSDV